MSGNKFPFAPKDHGDETVKITVGRGFSPQTFTIHRSLICSASQFFDRAFNGDFNETHARCMKLPHENLDAFEALYHWLYTGNFLPKKFLIEPLIEEDVYLLHVYAMADRLLIHRLSLDAYSAIQAYFSKKTLSMPSVRFIKELWSDCGLPQCKQKLLIEYTVSHCTFCFVAHPHTCCWKWQEVLRCHLEFGARLGVAFSERLSRHNSGSDDHPSDLHIFKDHTGQHFTSTKDCQDEGMDKGDFEPDDLALIDEAPMGSQVHCCCMHDYNKRDCPFGLDQMTPRFS
jgi:BTB/POZ domain